MGEGEAVWRSDALPLARLDQAMALQGRTDRGYHQQSPHGISPIHGQVDGFRPPIRIPAFDGQDFGDQHIRSAVCLGASRPRVILKIFYPLSLEEVDSFIGGFAEMPYLRARAATVKFWLCQSVMRAFSMRHNIVTSGHRVLLLCGRRGSI